MFQAFKVTDYTKIIIRDIDSNYLNTHAFLDFKRVVSVTTGEYQNFKVAEHHFCKIKVYDSGIILFSGSIHKMWNSIKGIKAPFYDKLTKQQKENYKGFNGNQFTINDIFEIREYLKTLFNCEPYQMIFQNIEFGVNTNIHFNPNKYINGLLFHKGVLFTEKYKRSFAQVEHQRYFLKIYNKSLQYGMPQNTLRVELKIKRMEEIKHIGIKTFGDINTSTLNMAKDLLLKRFDEVVYYDNTINKKNLLKLQKEQISYYSNQRYWMDDLNPNHRDRHKKRLAKIIQDNSTNLHQKIKQNIIQKCVIINQLSESVCV